MSEVQAGGLESRSGRQAVLIGTEHAIPSTLVIAAPSPVLD